LRKNWVKGKSKFNFSRMARRWRMMAHKQIATYLNNHLAGSTTAPQLTGARTALDELFQRYHLPRPSHYVPDFRPCRMMRIVHLAERRLPAVQQWIYHHYGKMATAYVAQLASDILEGS
jgi:hypothetical protein